MPDLTDSRFWLVWRENGGVPTRMHPFESLARTEAERLAREFPGSTFYVLEAKAAVRKNEVTWREMLAPTAERAPF